MTLIIFFRGLPGVGKSTIAKALAKNLSLPILDYDDIKGELCNHIKGTSLPNASYNVAQNILCSNVKSNVNMIFDSHGFYNEFFTKCVNLVGEDNVLLITCICNDKSILKERLSNRKNTYPSQVNDIQQVINNEHKMECINAKNNIEIDSCDTIDNNVSKIIKFINNKL